MDRIVLKYDTARAKAPVDKTPASLDVTLMEFNPNWLDKDGLPTQLGPWVQENLLNGESRTGVRFDGTKLLPFRINASNPWAFATYVDFNATIELATGREMKVRPGVIEVFSASGDGVLEARFVERRFETKRVWMLDMELRRHYERNYRLCPAFLNQTIAEIDAMMFELAGPLLRPSQEFRKHVVAHRSNRTTAMTYLANSIALGAKDRLTPPNLEAAYEYLSGIYHSGEPISRQGDFKDYHRAKELTINMIEIINTGELTSDQELS